ncbi:uncharacterized protein LOC116105702 [Pistacia vera]|uniref:uncharacterized protein LOC116105702 n=1 Tax=Pistacia vera TaxID=55513 RepID=UPI001263C15E|nr:uncharacterized protein LOC116105702 [Pistacia vera]
MTPFKALYGHDPPTLLKLTDYPSLVEDVNHQIREHNAILQELKHNLESAQVHMKMQADHHYKDINFVPSDNVYPRLQPYKFKSLAKKLNEKFSPRFYCPFSMLEKVGQVAYKLKILPKARIHPVFHMSQLKRNLHISVPIQPLPLSCADPS